MRWFTAFVAIALCGGVARAQDNLLTELMVSNWPTVGNSEFTFSIGSHSFSAELPTNFDMPVSAGFASVMQNGVDDMVRLQLGDNFFEKPESFFTNPANAREQTIDGVTRWQSSTFPTFNGIDWQGFRFTRFYVTLGNNPGNIFTSVEVRGFAPEPAGWLLAVIGFAMIACRSRISRPQDRV
jgi:hypothetical protein